MPTMTTKSHINVSIGIISVVVLICGTIFSILIAILYQMLGDVAVKGAEKVQREGGSNIDQYSPLSPELAISSNWVVGFTFLLPGVFGIIAALAQKRIGYIMQLAVCVIALLVMVLMLSNATRAFKPVSVDVLFSLKVPCSEFASCTEAKNISDMAVGAGIMSVIGTLLTAMAAILVVVLLCSRQDPSQGFVRRKPYPPPRIMSPPKTSPYVVAPKGYSVRPISSSPAPPGYADQHPIYAAQPGHLTHTGYGDSQTQYMYKTNYTNVHPVVDERSKYTRPEHTSTHDYTNPYDDGTKFLFNAVRT